MQFDQFADMIPIMAVLFAVYTRTKNKKHDSQKPNIAFQKCEHSFRSHCLFTSKHLLNSIRSFLTIGLQLESHILTKVIPSLHISWAIVLVHFSTRMSNGLIIIRKQRNIFLNEGMKAIITSVQWVLVRYVACAVQSNGFYRCAAWKTLIVSCSPVLVRCTFCYLNL